MKSLLRATDEGVFCERGGFHIDPLKPVRRAVITHAHGDHVRSASGSCLCTPQSLPLLRQRLGDDAVLQGLPYGETLDISGVKVSLHPAGHVLGSAQVRVEHGGHVWVVSGDYKRQPDPTCEPFVPVPCHVFITECTFGLPVFRWPSVQDVMQEICSWWRKNAEEKKGSILFAYATGKSQRILCRLQEFLNGPNVLDSKGLGSRGDSIGPVFAHGAILHKCEAYRDPPGFSFPPWRTLLRPAIPFN